MKNPFIFKALIIGLIFLDSCTFHRQAQKMDLQSLESVIVMSLRDRSDTILTLMKTTDGRRSEGTVTTFFTKGNGGAYYFLNSLDESYPDTAFIQDFDWKLLIDSYDRIRSEKPMPAYFGRVIEKDTSWELMRPNSPRVFVINIFLPDRLISWETNSFEMATNPSLTKTSILDYLLSISGHGEKTPWELFGNPERQKIIRHRRTH